MNHLNYERQLSFLCLLSVLHPVVNTFRFCLVSLFLSAEIREAFRVLDRDGNGFISKQELGMAMRSLGYMPSEVELAIIMQRLDMDGESHSFYISLILWFILSLHHSHKQKSVSLLIICKNSFGVCHRPPPILALKRYMTS